MPAAPWTTGSTTTAAISAARFPRTRSSAPAPPAARARAGLGAGRGRCPAARRPRGARVRPAEHCRVRAAVELLAHRRIDARMAVAVDVAPQRGDAVYVPPAVGVEQELVLGGDDHRR